ncbi:MAG: BrnA antitoxin family protein [Methylocystis sp.]|nr:BrnA antitoxin family protein [Methylocystis sp.]
MARKERIVRYTDEELRAMQARGESRSDWKAAAAMTDAEIEAAIASDPDEAGMVLDWSQTSAELPQPKAVLNMRIDRDVLDFFRRQGKGYQTKINAVLRSYVEQMLEHERR